MSQDRISKWAIRLVYVLLLVLVGASIWGFVYLPKDVHLMFFAVVGLSFANLLLSVFLLRRRGKKNKKR